VLDDVFVREAACPEIRRSLFRTSFSLILGETWLGRVETASRFARDLMVHEVGHGHPRLPERERPSLRGSIRQVDAELSASTALPLPFRVKNTPGVERVW